MANIKSQIKRIITNKKAQERNKAVKSELKTAIRATREAIAAGDKAAAEAALVKATKKLDKAVSKGVMHQNQAPAFRDRLPYILAYVTLEEGVQICTAIVECPVEDVRIGMPVEVVFDDVDDEIAIPHFRPRG